MGNPFGFSDIFVAEIPSNSPGESPNEPHNPSKNIEDSRREFQQTMERKLHVGFMDTPKKWPCFPILCLRHCTRSKDGLPLLGLMIYDWNTEGKLHRTTVFETNLFDLAPYGGQIDEEQLFATVPKTVYRSFDEIFDSGWRVD